MAGKRHSSSAEAAGGRERSRLGFAAHQMTVRQTTARQSETASGPRSASPIAQRPALRSGGDFCSTAARELLFRPRQDHGLAPERSDWR